MNLKRRRAHPTLALLTGTATKPVGAVPGTVGTDHGMAGGWGEQWSIFWPCWVCSSPPHQHYHQIHHAVHPQGGVLRIEGHPRGWAGEHGYQLGVEGGVGTPPGFPPPCPPTRLASRDIFRMPCAAVVGDIAVLTVEGGWIRQHVARKWGRS